MARMQARNYLLAIFGGTEARKSQECIVWGCLSAPNGYGAGVFGRVFCTNRRVSKEAGYYPVIFPS